MPVDTEETPELGSRWWDEHSEIDQRVDQVDTAIARCHVADAGRAIGALDDLLESHFTLEESVYFPLLERLAPELAPTLEAARAGHGVIRARLSELYDLVERARFDEAEHLLASLLQTMSVHENEEGKMIRRLQKLLEAEA